MSSTILLIEDDKEIQATVRLWMERAGFRVVAANSVVEGVVKLDNQRFDCVLLDMNLGKASGEDIVEYLRDRKDSQNHSTPIIVISAGLHAELVTRLRRQVVSMLVKPFSSHILLERVSSILPAHRKPQQVSG